MVQKREAYAPWSLTRKAGVESATVNGDIEVPQFIQPVLDTGFVDEKGDWKGVKSDDKDFIGFTTDEAIANGGGFLVPTSANHSSINMVGYNHLQFILKSSNDGNVRMDAVTGPATNQSLNVELEAAAAIKMAGIGDPQTDTGFAQALYDAAESLTAGFRIFTIYNRLANVPNVQLSIVNNTGDVSTFVFAFRRLV